MFLNQLPDECLLIIFRLMNDLDDLLNCYKVCSKWHHLIEERTRKVKYLVVLIILLRIEKVHEQLDPKIPFQPHLVYIGDFSYGFRKKVKYEDIVTLVKQMKSLKGLIREFYDTDYPILQHCDQLEMVSSDYIEPCMEKSGVNIKQLHLWSYTLDLFKRDAHYFPNLERLSIYNNAGRPDVLYDGPILRKLKIVELALSSYHSTDIYYGFQFMDSCPNLQSAHINLDADRINIFFESIKHEPLRDLVIEWYDPDYADSVNWDEFKRLFMKYPNLKHLSLVGNKSLDDDHVEQLVRILPNLVLFAVRECRRVTQKAADYIQDYNKLYGRSIKFYFDENYNEIRSDFPQLLTKYVKISEGFDFMKHCFLKHFHSLSTFLISDED
uniref:F-box domain-containing protein n=1 Tax=Tetranychus urticae TaxID=32264 RepID=T1JRV0_TETUR